MVYCRIIFLSRHILSGQIFCTIKIPDPNENIFPPLNVDLDVNNVPDGYNMRSEWDSE